MNKQYLKPIKWPYCKPSPWPDKKWRAYWCHKRHHASNRGVWFGLTIEEALHLISIAPERPSRMGYHLGRKNHNEGYVLENVEWITREENLRQAEYPRPPTTSKGYNRRWGVPRYKDGSIVRKYRGKNIQNNDDFT